MTPELFLETILDPGLAWCAALPGWTIPPSDKARVLLLAIAGQESAWHYRVQQSPGASAHGLWQFERNGGVKGVLTHASTFRLATAACAAAGVPSDATHAWGFMTTSAGDHLATAFARLLLWSDPKPLPGILDAHDRNAAWDMYERNWRPGKPGPDRWAKNWYAACMAIAAVKGTP